MGNYMKPTDLNYESTINVGRIKTDALETILAYLYQETFRIENEIQMILNELAKRQGE